MCKLHWLQGQTPGALKEIPSSKSEGVLTLTEPSTPHCQDHLGDPWQHRHPPWNKWPARVAEAIIKVAQTAHRELFGYQHHPHIAATGWLHLGPDPQYKQSGGMRVRSTKQDQHQPWHHTQHSDMWTAIWQAFKIILQEPTSSELRQLEGDPAESHPRKIRHPHWERASGAGHYAEQPDMVQSMPPGRQPTYTQVVADHSDIREVKPLQQTLYFFSIEPLLNSYLNIMSGVLFFTS